TVEGFARADVYWALVPKGPGGEDMYRLACFAVLAACGAVKANDIDGSIDSPGAPITPATIQVTQHPIAGGPVTCTIVTQASGGSGTLTSHGTWTQDGVAFANTMTTTFTDDTIPGDQTHTGHAFACTVVTTDGQSTAMSMPATTTVEGRFAFVIEDGAEALMKIDLDAGTLVNVGPLNVVTTFGDLAWDAATQTMFMVDARTPTNTNGLYRVNLSTGAATLVGSHGQTDMFALAFDPVTHKLFGGVRGAVAPTLFSLNTATGAATQVGGTTSYEGLVFDTKRSQMVAILGSTAAIVTVNTTTGATTMVANPGGTNDCGMTYDPIVDRFWVADHSGVLFQYDPNNGFARTTVKTF